MILAQETPNTGNVVLIYILFLLAGLLVGGAWTVYRNHSKFLGVALGGCAAMAAAAGIVWAIGFYTS
ncbi:hypothetical protein [Corynebacterium pseudopelargi]|uniref:Uncharacterized protein n=1 Tax=Corynebacterium pseudopelargi TaxID=2080757 RepID=A0A3G6ITH1_9CORY|nr:hypothetical protein [Corynebacterium pseudopelargi]AZA08963.1 hypothetical protein CPPEL_04180 [Corynebacterium pseudopelargi]